MIANEALADKVHGFFALRMAFKTWELQYGRRRAMAWTEEKEKERLRPIFDSKFSFPIRQAMELTMV